MKLFLAFVFLHVLAFQVAGQRPTSTVAPVTDEPAPDDLDTTTTTYNDGNMETTSTESTVGPDEGNTSSNATGTAGGGSFSNDTVGDEDVVKKRHTFFYNYPLGTLVVCVLALILLIVCLSPMLHRLRKHYARFGLARAPEEADNPPTYQDLMRGNYY